MSQILGDMRDSVYYVCLTHDWASAAAFTDMLATCNLHPALIVRVARRVQYSLDLSVDQPCLGLQKVVVARSLRNAIGASLVSERAHAHLTSSERHDD